jgi:hypothetical protein
MVQCQSRWLLSAALVVEEVVVVVVRWSPGTKISTRPSIISARLASTISAESL